jgi:antitoxin (DNA-binding transcriptional repressor) of toxin-antitoxin stability system
MRVAGVRELRGNLAGLLDGAEPVLVTRHGRLSGVFLPLDDPDHIPTDLRRELAAVLGRHLHVLLEAQGVSEDDVLEDFKASRRERK